MVNVRILFMGHPIIDAPDFRRNSKFGVNRQLTEKYIGQLKLQMNYNAH
jgi:hypothetical protein